MINQHVTWQKPLQLVINIFVNYDSIHFLSKVTELYIKIRIYKLSKPTIKIKQD